MKKIFKLIVIIFCIFILFIMIDICYIFIFNRPLFVIENRCGDCSDKVYTGLFYDTYYCHEVSVRVRMFRITMERSELLNEIPIFSVAEWEGFEPSRAF